MSAAAAAVALPVSALVIWALLRSPLARRLIAQPTGERWSDQPTPTFGGIGLFLGLVAAIAAVLAAGGAPHAHRELLGVMAGATLLFLVGLVDDLYSLPAGVKLAAQGGAAAIALALGFSVEIVGNDVLAAAIGVVWLVGMTNAFNLLDNMDGLAASLATIAATLFAIDAVTVHPDRLVLVLSLGLALTCLGFLPFNFRPGRSAEVFMGDSGSQVLGFTLGALGLAASWKVAETTVATLVLPLVVLAVPILDTALVAITRLMEGRPVHQGGKDHSSHRLVRGGLSERSTVVLLAAIAAGLGATSLAWSVLDDYRITLVGVLVTFVLLVQFAGFLVDLDRERVEDVVPRAWMLRTVVLHRRRLLEVLVDFALVSLSFYVAYVVVVGGNGTSYERHVFTVALPALLVVRYLAFIPLGLYQGVWRFAGSREAAAIVIGVVISEPVAFGIVAGTTDLGGFPAGIFVVDALLCTMLIGASRFGERALFRARATVGARGDRRRTVIVGAGRSGRSLARELRETPGEHVVGFVDDDPRLHRRRLLGVPVHGGSSDIERILEATGPDTVLVTIPQASPERLDAVVRACAAADVPCRFVRRETDLDPLVVLGAGAAQE
jgi:UDP-GlcNAc:undecaprenyl-phosphate/decaprenyl-phosphate GlcNAc-1-phosphate transferase